MYPWATFAPLKMNELVLIDNEPIHIFFSVWYSIMDPAWGERDVLDIPLKSLPALFYEISVNFEICEPDQQKETGRLSRQDISFFCQS